MVSPSPHGKVGRLEKTLYCFGRSEDGIGFDASQSLKQTEIKRRLRLATDKQQIIDIFQQSK